MNHAAKGNDIDDGVDRLVDGQIAINIRLTHFAMTPKQIADGFEGSKSGSCQTVEWEVAGKHKITSLHVFPLPNDLGNLGADHDVGTASLQLKLRLQSALSFPRIDRSRILTCDKSSSQWVAPRRCACHELMLRSVSCSVSTGTWGWVANESVLLLSSLWLYAQRFPQPERRQREHGSSLSHLTFNRKHRVQDRWARCLLLTVLGSFTTLASSWPSECPLASSGGSGSSTPDSGMDPSVVSVAGVDSPSLAGGVEDAARNEQLTTASVHR